MNVDHVVRPGIDLHFQSGPIQESGVNGAQIEEVIEVLVERLTLLNAGALQCKENSCAITHLQEAAHWLDARTVRRQRGRVEGTVDGCPGDGA